MIFFFLNLPSFVDIIQRVKYNIDLDYFVWKVWSNYFQFMTCNINIVSFLFLELFSRVLFSFFFLLHINKLLPFISWFIIYYEVFI